jgi:GPI ethanolamine phosphate transferase 1
MLGGALMVAVGVIYLVFESKILAELSNTAESKLKGKDNNISRILMGIQVSKLRGVTSAGH